MECRKKPKSHQKSNWDEPRHLTMPESIWGIWIQHLTPKISSQCSEPMTLTHPLGPPKHFGSTGRRRCGRPWSPTTKKIGLQTARQKLKWKRPPRPLASAFCAIQRPECSNKVKLFWEKNVPSHRYVERQTIYKGLKDGHIQAYDNDKT